MKNINIPNWLTYGPLFIAAFLFVFLFSCTTSPLYEHYPFWFHGDSGIFQEMGVCLLQGGTPYVDLFDHKGPILWFIQALGIGLNPRWGLMALQSISLFCTLLLWYKSSLLLVERQIPAIIITLSGLIFLLAFYQRGNLCEEWSLPFISLPIYLYVKRSGTRAPSPAVIPGTRAPSPAVMQQPQARTPAYQHTDAFIVGLSVGIIAMIRLNNTAPIVGFVLWHFIECIKNKDFRRLCTDVTLILAGMAIVFDACALFYLAKARWTGVYEMIYGTFIFNFLYVAEGSGPLSFVSKLQHYVTPLLFLTADTILLIHDKKTLFIIWPTILSFVVTLFAIGSFGFVHYMIIFIPLLVLSICLAVKSRTKITFFIYGSACVFSLFLSYDAVDHLLFRVRGNIADTTLNDGFHRFANSLSDDERNSIYNAGLNNMGAGLFADEGICQCNRIISANHSNISPRLMEYLQTHGIKDLRSAWVLTQSPNPEATDDYMATHYTLADSIPGGEFDPIWCWKWNAN